jgi:hypothetical protein
MSIVDCQKLGLFLGLFLFYTEEVLLCAEAVLSGANSLCRFLLDDVSQTSGNPLQWLLWNGAAKLKKKKRI